MPGRKAITPKKPLLVEIRAVIRRFLKPDQNVNWPREMATFKRLWAGYPNLSFWLSYEPPFGQTTPEGGPLNMMSWFESIEGKEDLDRAWLLYNWNPAPVRDSSSVEPLSLSNSNSTIDSNDPSAVPLPLPPRRPKTLAEFLKSGKTNSN